MEDGPVSDDQNEHLSLVIPGGSFQSLAAPLLATLLLWFLGLAGSTCLCGSACPMNLIGPIFFAIAVAVWVRSARRLARGKRWFALAMVAVNVGVTALLVGGFINEVRVDRRRAKDAVTTRQIADSLIAELEAYRAKNGRYPCLLQQISTNELITELFGGPAQPDAIARYQATPDSYLIVVPDYPFNRSIRVGGGTWQLCFSLSCPPKDYAAYCCGEAGYPRCKSKDNGL